MTRLLVIVLIALGGCADNHRDTRPPTGQVILQIATDAPLPHRNLLSPTGVQPLFDRMLVEVYPPGQSIPCQECTRDFEIDSEFFADNHASLGIVPQPNRSGVRVRVRIYRSAGVSPAHPRPDSTLERVIQLPLVPPEGITDVQMALRVQDIGIPQGTLDHPLDPESPGTPLPVAGSWEGNRSIPCPGAAREDEVCVPGGAFWMGDPRLRVAAYPDMGGQREHLVVVSPFFVDKSEVSVQAFRASGLAETLPNGVGYNPHVAEPGTWAPCAYTPDPGLRENMPVNCITWRKAREYCEHLGKTLPTEAQWEYVAGGLASRRFVWGADEPTCVDAVFGRGGDDSCCHNQGLGPAVVGTGQRDRWKSLEGDVVDLVGNLSEFTLDFWNSDDGPCWGAGLLKDPLCSKPDLEGGIGRTVRGGNFSLERSMLWASRRQFVDGESAAIDATIGFRCARTFGG